jgi:phosphoenolpyruvate synthase/pyruvate phosphate dikinase
MTTMDETAFEKQIMNKLASVEKKVDYIMEYIEDTRLSEDDKRALAEALEEEREGKLLNKKQVFG